MYFRKALLLLMLFLCGINSACILNLTLNQSLAIDPDYCTGLCDEQGNSWWEITTENCGDPTNNNTECTGACAGQLNKRDATCFGAAQQEPTNQECTTEALFDEGPARNYECQVLRTEPIPEVEYFCKCSYFLTGLTVGIVRDYCVLTDCPDGFPP
ncbi:hypothetical protein [Gimesia aquarii]|uniref:Uncharacterized protein n=1 Tax=Gimesia aquarii TaxID=2527964 RepID=A0A517W153_9PLAN|nr:hypothetical protein [Gimesia aquarii]QDT98981.1 hypothetical protein V144x_44910 [Gimesia aquarii]